MAILEKNYSERGLGTPQPAPMNPNVASTEGQMFIELGDKTTDIAQHLEKAHITAEEAKARNIYESVHAEVLNRAAQETNLTPEKQKSYQEELRTALNKSSETIALQNQRDLFVDKYSPKAEIAEAKLNSIFLKRYRDQARAEFLKSRSIQGSGYVTTNNLNEKSMYVQELHADIQQQVDSAYMTKEEGEATYQRTLKEWDHNHMKNDLETRPQWLLEEAQKGEKGFYKGINPAERSNFIAQAKKRVHSLEVINRDQTEANLVMRKAAGEDITEDLDEKFLNKTISRSFFEKYKGADNVQFNLTGETDPATFYDLTNVLVTPGITPEKAREKLLEAVGQEKLSFQDFQKLYKMHLIPQEGDGAASMNELLGPKAQGDFATIKTTHDAQQKQLQDKKNFWHGAFQMFDHTLGDDERAVTQARQKLYERMGKNPAGDVRAEAGKVLSEHAISLRPDITQASDKGILLQSNGVSRRYFKDGHYEEVEK